MIFVSPINSTDELDTAVTRMEPTCSSLLMTVSFIPFPLPLHLLKMLIDCVSNLLFDLLRNGLLHQHGVRLFAAPAVLVHIYLDAFPDLFANVLENNGKTSSC